MFVNCFVILLFYKYDQNYAYNRLILLIDLIYRISAGEETFRTLKGISTSNEYVPLVLDMEKENTIEDLFSKLSKESLDVFVSS